MSKKFGVARVRAAGSVLKGEFLYATADGHVSPLKSRNPEDSPIGIALEDARTGERVEVELSRDVRFPVWGGTSVVAAPDPAVSLERLGAALEALGVTDAPAGVIGQECLAPESSIAGRRT